MQFTLFGFHIRVEAWFWLTAVLLGGGLNAEAYASAANMANIGIWVILAFFSVLIHELGHASLGRRFGADPEIVLQGFGGAAIMDVSRFSRWQHFLMVAAGPAASITLGIAASAALDYLPSRNLDIRSTLNQLKWINYTWTVLNLLPVQPLDGGHMLRIFLGEKRFNITCLVGVVVGAGIAVLSLRFGLVFLTLIMALFAFENWRALRR